MNVLILSSANDEIDDYYKSIARSVSHFLAINDCNLVFGGSSKSMMGICYDEFIKNERQVYAYSTMKYSDELKKISLANKILCEDTFDMKKQMFNNSELIVILPGGIGTLSELLTFIEEKRSNDKKTPILIYDENHFYEKIYEMIDILKKQHFLDNNINDYYEVVKNKEEFEQSFDKVYYKRRER